MRVSFNDEDSFKEAVESLRFNSSDPSQQLGSSNSMPLENSEMNEDNVTPSDPITLQRMRSSSSLSVQETWRSGDIRVCFNSPSNPEFTGTSANGM